MTLFISAENLKAKLEQQKLRIIDVRPHEDYIRSHIPGAIHFDMVDFNARLAGEPYPTVGLLPSIEDFNEAVAIASINTEDKVVVYDDAAGPPAARFAWTLKTFGHKNTSILNGGFQHWLHLGLATSTAITKVPSGTFKGELQTDRIADRDYILNKLDSKETLIIDARTANEFKGEDLRASRGGHIPGAINLNWTATKDEKQTNLFKPDTELKKLFEKHDIEQHKEIICYCQSHQRSAVLCLLLENLGYSNVKGYPGAWSDWGNQTNTPVKN